MDKFVINKKSWHYRFLVLMGNTDWDMSKVKDFCSYWRKFIGAVFLLTVIVVLAIVLSGLLVSAIIINPTQTAVGIVSVIAVIGSIILVLYLAGLASKKTKDTLYSDSLIGTKYKSWKSKYCPMVEYKD